MKCQLGSLLFMENSNPNDPLGLETDCLKTALFLKVNLSGLFLLFTKFFNSLREFLYQIFRVILKLQSLSDTFYYLSKDRTNRFDEFYRRNAGNL